jgi:hypothetical protein
MQKKALYVRLKGIPEGVIFLFFNIAKTIINKEFMSFLRKQEFSLLPHNLLAVLDFILLGKLIRQAHQVGQVSRRSFYFPPIFSFWIFL